MADRALIFDWDEGNRGHVSQHNITPEEAEEVFLGEPLDIELQIIEDDEERLLQIGETGRGRVLQIVTTWREGKIRVISAWDAPRQLKSYYLAEMRKRYGDTEDSEV